MRRLLPPPKENSFIKPNKLAKQYLHVEVSESRFAYTVVYINPVVSRRHRKDLIPSTGSAQNIFGEFSRL